MSNEITTIDRRSNRQGRYDVDVQIFRNNEMIDGLLSQVVPGDCFSPSHRPGVWFKCLTPIRTSTANRSEYSVQNPTFSMHGLEVLQAAPTVDRAPKLINPVPRLTVAEIRSIGEPQPSTGSGEIPKASWDLDDDVIDIQFTEVPDVKRLT